MASDNDDNGLCVASSRMRKADGSIIDMALLVEAVRDSIQDDSLVTKITQNVLKKINVDSAGRLRVAAETVANITTVTNVTNCPAIGATSIGPMLAPAFIQKESNVHFQLSFGRNLVRS